MTSLLFPADSTVLDDDAIREHLRAARTIAIVGWSDKTDRPSHEIGAFLHKRGYDLALVNPRLAGKMGPYGEQVYGSLTEIPRHVDIVDIFRRPVDTIAPTRQAAEIGAGMVWLQAGISSDEARAIAAEHGIPYVQNNCISVAWLFLLRGAS